MNDRPYTDNDLQLEAARLHAEFARQEDEVLVGEAMEKHCVPSLGEPDQDNARTWVELLEPEGEGTPEYVAAQQAVTALMNGAADTSVWAVSLGVDGLEPVTDVIDFPSATLDADFARMHFAFHPDVPADTRTHVINRIRNILAANL